jgi:transcriptional regulator with XRE-family HTH domain
MTDAELELLDIGRRITERRKQMGLTQEALAEKGNMTTQFVSYAEAGKRAMRPENLLKLSSALNVSADYLLTGEIVDKDLLILSDKMRSLTPSQLRIVENIIDECNKLYGDL